MKQGKVDNRRDHRRYYWPADKITAEDMIVLYKIRLKTGTPINQLLKNAVRLLENAEAGKAQKGVSVNEAQGSA